MSIHLRKQDIIVLVAGVAFGIILTLYDKDLALHIIKAVVQAWVDFWNK